MIKNYLTVAFRNLTKHKFYALINIFGLSVGLTCFLFIVLYVTDEITYDNFQKDIQQVYRMDFEGNIGGSVFITALASAPTAKTMIADFPEVADAVRMRGTGNWLLRKKSDDITFKEELAVYADKKFFTFFDLPLLRGDVQNIISRPKTVAISESLAKKIFGDVDPIGEVLVFDNESDYEVTGVFKDMPVNMHFHYNLLISMEGLEEAQRNMWMSFNFNTYLKLTPGSDPMALESKFPALVEKYIGPEIEQYMGQTMEEFVAAGNSGGFSLMPMQDIHLKSDKLGELEPNGDIKYVYIFSAIAIFILILACINFMNLATARSANRAKEVGVRKVLGAYRQNLIYQFLSEAFLITLFSIIIAFLMLNLLLPYFNDLANKSIVASRLFSLEILGCSILILILVAFLAGSYPAFYLSSFNPIEVLKGKISKGTNSINIRSSLVVIQFTISIIMITCTVIVLNQLNYIQNRKLGYDKNQVIMLHDAWLMGDKLKSYKNEMLNETGIVSGTIASFLPVGTTNNNNLWFAGKVVGQGASHVINNYDIDHDYIETLSMNIVAGRNFSREFTSDTTSVIINQSAAREFGYLIDPVGNFLCTYGGSQDQPTSVYYKIIGIVEDFHFSNMRNSIEPLVFTLGESRGFVSFRIEAENTANTIEILKTKWNEFAPGQPFQYSFLDDRFDRLYQNETRIGRIFGVFASLAIFIACLGLYGLASFTAEQKTKEIGIRKVLGANVIQVIGMLNRQFLKLVLISYAIGAIIAYFAMKEWLNGFAYRVDINEPTQYILAGLLAIIIALITMSSQSFRAAISNPVNSLKSE